MRKIPVFQSSEPWIANAYIQIYGHYGKRIRGLSEATPALQKVYLTNCHSEQTLWSEESATKFVSIREIRGKKSIGSGLPRLGKQNEI